MSLPRLYAKPDTPEEWQAWTFNHQANHFDIIAAGERYQQTSFTLATNLTTLAGNSVMSFASVPTASPGGIQNGMIVSDVTAPSAITAGSQVVAFSATEVQIGLPAASNINSGDSILFSPGTNVKALTTYQLSPIDPANLGFWLYNHAIMHQQINAVLGTSGFNLIDVDFEDPDQFAEWIQQNGDEHQRICAALGIG